MTQPPLPLPVVHPPAEDTPIRARAEKRKNARRDALIEKVRQGERRRRAR